jgi:MoaD family protein
MRGNLSIRVDPLRERVNTIRVEIGFFSTVRVYTDVQAINLDLPVKSSVRDLLVVLAGIYGDDFDAYMLGEDDDLNEHVTVLVNGRGVKILDDIETILSDGDRVAILPAIGGG